MVVTTDMLLAPRRQRPGMLLSILQFTGSPTTKDYPARNINCAEAEKLLYAHWNVLSNRYSTLARRISFQNQPSDHCACCLGVKVKTVMGLPGGAVVKNPPANAGDRGSSPGPGRSHMPQNS